MHIVPWPQIAANLMRFSVRSNLSKIFQRKSKKQWHQKIRCAVVKLHTSLVSSAECSIIHEITYYVFWNSEIIHALAERLQGVIVPLLDAEQWQPWNHCCNNVSDKLASLFSGVIQQVWYYLFVGIYCVKLQWNLGQGIFFNSCCCHAKNGITYAWAVGKM